MKNPISVSVGIPAFNEEKNIKILLTSLLSQRGKLFNLDKIFVISDASTDATEKKAREIIDSRVVVKSNQKRIGKSKGLNKIFSLSSSDLLILMDGDVYIDQKNLIELIVEKFLNTKGAGLITVKVSPVMKKMSFVEKVLSHSQNMKIFLNDKILSSNPLYLCVGRTMGYSKKLYKKLIFPNKLIAEDAYSYLKAKEYGFKVGYQKMATIYYQPPKTISDHSKQSVRFFDGKNQLAKYFDSKQLENEYNLSSILLLKAFIWGFFKAPLLTIAYFIFLVYTKFLSIVNKNKTSFIWSVSETSKIVGDNNEK
ncbi:glycosyltransferase family 2 protein [Candidatus Woesebacteria bacterium]|nr:glycosyltransferase family 2 protein [Candidatus Woesebacteria bacterium]